MTTQSRFVVSLLVILCAAGAASAQTQQPAGDQGPAARTPIVVTATASAGRVRFAALGEVHQTRLQVFNVEGAQVFDPGFRLGNLVAWGLTDQQGARLTDGPYLFLVTVKDFNGGLTQKYGTAVLEQGRVYLLQMDVGEMPAPQATALEANKLDAALDPVDRVGAAGLHRAETGGPADGVPVEGGQAPRAPDSNAPAGGTTSNVSGTGTTGKLVKWTDGPTGALGDSIVHETAAKIGVGTTAPTAKLDVAGTVNTTLQYNIAGLRVLSVAGTDNTFAGVSAGPSNTGSDNSFYGKEAGLMNTGGLNNSFYGSGAGRVNQTGGNNAFFGYQAGRQNTASGNSFFGSQAGVLNTTGDKNSFFGIQAGGFNKTGFDNSYFGNQAGVSGTSANQNSFFGSQAGLAITTGSQDSFFGTRAGAANKSGTFNSFFGSEAGFSNTTGNRNSFFGNIAGVGNTTGGSNSFFGISAGSGNQTGSNNTIIGSFADVGSNNLSNATAIGHRAYVTQSNSLVLGSIDNVNLGSADTRVGIGVTAPSAKLHVAGASNVATTPVMILQSSGSQIPLAFRSGATEAARIRANDGGSLVFATLNGTEKNIHLRAGDDSATDLFIQSSTGRVGIGTTTPNATLDVAGDIKLDVNPGSGVELCAAYNVLLIVNCSASSIHYKENVLDFRSGLDVVRRLRPVIFNWKNDGQKDIGLVAEEVNRVEPLLSTYEPDGGVDGVRYNRLPVLLINAVQEQQRLIEARDERIKRLEQQNAEQSRRIAEQEQRLRALEQAVTAGGLNGPIQAGKSTRTRARRGR